MTHEFSLTELADAAAWAAQMHQEQMRNPHWQRRRQHMPVDIERHQLMVRMLWAAEERLRAMATEAAK